MFQLASQATKTVQHDVLNNNIYIIQPENKVHSLPESSKYHRLKKPYIVSVYT